MKILRVIWKVFRRLVWETATDNTTGLAAQMADEAYAAAGATLYHKEGKDLSMQLEANNLTDRINILNFASLFSGTAVAPPRSVSVRLKAAF